MRFTDTLSREWTLEINVAAMRRAKKQDIDLSMPVSQLQQFVMDDVFMSDCLFAILSPACAAKGISQEQFDEGLDGKVIDDAREGLWLALEGYFDPKKAEMLRAALNSVKEELALATASLTSTGSTDAKASSAIASTAAK